ncbi:aromatic compound dioxygenase [Daldinia caldariorum]|uniref:aromatic compound dioxygenase n=1 Tax=Daldinia caldariorum TaxID=326644 RepID=UPI00200858AD|nr:aromatic compound dioxygenase [Daldinia caldariorum]KAI1464774.1 aromatic compound dioxygenase [Daldinia caldariorum]
MALSGKEDGGADRAAKTKYDPEFTDKVIAATGPKALPRLKEIMPSLLRHLHDFARDVDLTVAELFAGIELINEAGRMSTDKRNETGMLCDILGLESLADEISSKLLSDSGSSGTATPSTVLGPFYRANAPLLPSGSSIVYAAPDSPWSVQAAPWLTHLSGRVVSASTGEPAAGAVVDVWMADARGLYEQQDAGQPEMNLRGRVRADEATGRYAVYCVRPSAYQVPRDGPGGRLLELLDRHPYRPAHMHFVVTAPGFRALTTQVFDRDDEHVRDDTVFAVKDELLVKFEPREGDDRARWTVEYDFALSEA